MVNSKIPEIREYLALFDVSSQLSFIFKNLANRFNPQGTHEELHIVSFGNKLPKPSLTSKAKIEARNGRKKVIRLRPI